ncbi:sensor histidine kinase [Aliiroseovarius sp. PTFE2010]|uniref:sensor histidine kinase n=1 Tax=Aliiroseovarius sp. PTFE2010 TaxID=3417190 RepID=UPI003CF91830
MQTLRSLRVGGVGLVLVAFALGLLSASLWLQSNARWSAYLDNAKFAGAVLYDSLQTGGEPPVGVRISPLDAQDQARAQAGIFEQVSGIAPTSLVTNFSIRPDLTRDRISRPLTLAVLSSDLRYPLAAVSSRADQTPAETMGALTMLLATYCSDPILIAKLGQAPWVQIDGDRVWSCAAAPSDLRLLAAGISLVAIGALVTLVLNSSAQFSGFAQMLRHRNRIGGPQFYQTEGLYELREIVSSVNSYLAGERDRLAERAAVLSGVSHDLGTPATRLKLRAALIPDADLRAKLEADIDSMTGIIESVLTYTRAELDAEVPRKLSLKSLLQSIVDDYQDIGRPVEFAGTQKMSVHGAPSLFMSRRGVGSLGDDDKVIVLARPVTLARAVSNLIDNALKYGRRATVSLEKDADHAVIIVQDEGNDMSAAEVENLMAPYRRGSNTQLIDGHGLGLTIASTVANLHGGTLTFEPGAKGLLARITILRR